MEMDNTEDQKGKNPNDIAENGSKRSRTVSVSGRLRSASILCDSGKISNEDKDSMKDLILTQDPLVEQAFIEFDAGDESKLLELVNSGYLKKKSEFHFLDGLGDIGLGSLSLNTFPDDGENHPSMFGFDNGFETPMEHDIPEELDLDGMDVVRAENSKRSRGSIDYPMYTGSVEDSHDNQRNSDHLSGYSFNQNEDDNAPNDFVSYRQMSAIHPDGIDYNSHYDSDTMSFSAQDASIMTSSYIDTSTLTLSEYSHSDERRLPPPGLTPINTQAESQKKYIGIYSPESRKKRVERFFEKRKQRVWTKKVKYDVRKNFADSRLRVKGRFVKKEDEELLRELMNLA